METTITMPYGEYLKTKEIIEQLQQRLKTFQETDERVIIVDRRFVYPAYTGFTSIDLPRITSTNSIETSYIKDELDSLFLRYSEMKEEIKNLIVKYGADIVQKELVLKSKSPFYRFWTRTTLR